MQQPDISVCLFTSDLRLHDQPVLRAALRGGRAVVPLFVLDDAVRAAGFAAPNRLAFLADCLADLDAGLRRRGARLVLRSGPVVDEVCAVVSRTGARAVHIAAGVGAYARRREERLRSALAAQGCELTVHSAVITAAAPGEQVPQGRDHYAVFGPYFRRRQDTAFRRPLGVPRSIPVPRDIDAVGSLELPERKEPAGVSPGLPAGGERAGRRALASWLRGPVFEYAAQGAELAADATSRLSPHLHFGTLSATELAHRTGELTGEGPEAFGRQLAWRDFHHQVLAARPHASWTDYRTRNDRWRHDEEEAQAWRDGRTGFPVIDAAMRQLRYEGWMPGRARMLVASFLTKTLYLDWRTGARHFLDLLVDGDIANNQLNWQWMAGTGTDTRPNRVLNPVLQARRHDPHGVYVRHWLPELADLDDRAVHEPWKLPARERSRLDYPAPIVELPDALARFRRARDLD
ncbi:deoxyribodipyrimidine photo-lyase [Streptomyces triticagri]|uniref:Deoxyribodipyrimidine photo-lyase n=1 Tax=Streptomyces triticagri TaxID=2293568 RepID=A0A372M3Q9_9ACTN|nr:deoxyribodipyrimidine photo-lyase [Streptomyces triticagri]RFU85521.1 deoxyribodipyrimidine photo-lyase [Streptomyces triticagri]